MNAPTSPTLLTNTNSVNLLIVHKVQTRYLDLYIYIGNRGKNYAC